MGMVELASYYSKIRLTDQYLSDIFIFVFLLFLEQMVSYIDCIINNGNILTDGRWKCHYHSGKRLCWRE